MKKNIIFFIVLCASIVSHYSFAQQTTTAELPNTAELLNSNAVASEQRSAEPISTRDTIALGDSIVVIHTVCAPLCSSHVRIYNQDWKELGILYAPFQSAFPEAYIENGKLLWRDNDPYDYIPAP
jgi:hypothetical protein